jgi:hypothetical protein
MIRQRVNSSTIRSVGFDSARSVLEVEFVRGGVYEYVGVPEFLYRGFLMARSKGGFFNDKIQGRYEQRQVEK